MERILLYHCRALLMDEADTLLEGAYVVVEGETISSVGTQRPQGPFDREIDCGNNVLMPGLVNAHTHIPMTLLRGYGGGCDLHTWLNQWIFPTEAKLDGRAVRAGDFVFAWQRLADPANDSPSASLLSVVAGYDAVRETGDVSLLQVTAEDDSTLVVVLNGKFDWFLTEVCTAPATMPLRQDLLQEETAAADGETAEAAAEPAEAAPWWNDLTGLVTNGPYQVSGYEAGEALTLEASETYRNSFSGPQTLTFRFAETAEADRTSTTPGRWISWASSRRSS